MVQRWNDVADTVRQQRAAVDQVTSLPINGKLLRAQIEAAAAAVGVVPPSGSKVRRAIGSWHRSRIRDQFGPILPPVANLDAILDQLARFSRSLQPQVAVVTAEIIAELVAEARPLPVGAPGSG
jgi:hypothetical protein